MPGRNINKTYLADSYYHIYARGHNKNTIFHDDDDYAVFLNLFKRYLSNKPIKDKKGREYTWLHNEIELLAYCLMPNHLHALVYQHNAEALTKLFKPILTTYGMYLNKKYKRSGPVLQSRFRASLIYNDAYLTHISRYLHLNPNSYKTWSFSSLPYYVGTQSAEWLRPDKILSLFDGQEEYGEFLEDYEDHKAMLDEIKAELAGY